MEFSMQLSVLFSSKHCLWLDLAPSLLPFYIILAGSAGVKAPSPLQLHHVWSSLVVCASMAASEPWEKTSEPVLQFQSQLWIWPCYLLDEWQPFVHGTQVRFNYLTHILLSNHVVLNAASADGPRILVWSLGSLCSLHWTLVAMLC